MPRGGPGVQVNGRRVKSWVGIGTSPATCVIRQVAADRLSPASIIIDTGVPKKGRDRPALPRLFGLSQPRQARQDRDFLRVFSIS